MIKISGNKCLNLLENWIFNLYQIYQLTNKAKYKNDNKKKKCKLKENSLKNPYMTIILYFHKNKICFKIRVQIFDILFLMYNHKKFRIKLNIL